MKPHTKNKEQFLGEAAKLYDELALWREGHGTASFDELAAQTTVKRQALMGELLGMLATQTEAASFVGDRRCGQCGGVLHDKGLRRRTVLHGEGQTVLERSYYHCDQCGHGFFPSGPDIATR